MTEIVVTPSMMRRWHGDALAFAIEVCGFKPDRWQEKVLRAAAGNPLIALLACKGPGKSALLAVLVSWFLFTRHDANVMCVSITGANLRDGLWKELARVIGGSAILSATFEWSAERISHRARPETWFASFRTWSPSADPQAQANAIAGFHSKNVLMVLDEVSEYPSGVFAAAEAALGSGKDCRLFCAGNPTKTSGPLYDIATKERGRYLVVEITGDPDDPDRAPRVDLAWARSMVAKYGRDSNIVRTNILGKFPLRASDSLFGVDDITAAQKRVVQLDELAPIILTVDVARFGDDESVIRLRQGLVAYMPWRYRELDTMQLAARVAHQAQRLQPDAVFVDVVGIGAGVVDRLRQLGVPNVIEVNNGAKATRPGFKLLRDQCYSELADWLRAGASLPEEPELVPELLAHSFKFNSANQLEVLPKDDVKALLGGKSPDLADSLALGFAQPIVAGRKARMHQDAVLHGASRAVDYNPYTKRSA